MATLTDRLSGRAMVKRTRASGIRAALNPQEMIGIAGLAILGVALLSPETNLGTLLGGQIAWGMIALMLVAPQAIGLSLARFGFVEVPMAHAARMMLLLTSFSTTLIIGYSFVVSGPALLGGGLSFLIAAALASASRYVHLYNGRSRQPPYIDEAVNATLRRYTVSGSDV